MTVDYYFDPACPWTWYTATWLTTAAEERGLEIHGHPMSLWVINKGEVPEEFREALQLSNQALRLIQSLDSEGRYEELWRFYRELGSRLFDNGVSWSPEVIVESANAAGVVNITALSDQSLDQDVEKVTNEAMARGGQDIGSPLLVLPNVEKGFHGPIVDAEPMSVDEAITLWDAVTAIVSVPKFFELKHGRG